MCDPLTRNVTLITHVIQLDPITYMSIFPATSFAHPTITCHQIGVCLTDLRLMHDAAIEQMTNMITRLQLVTWRKTFGMHQPISELAINTIV